jgi:uncharacterized protein YdaT
VIILVEQSSVYFKNFKALAEKKRLKAIEIMNNLINDGYEEDIAIMIALLRLNESKNRSGGL